MNINGKEYFKSSTRKLFEVRNHDGGDNAEREVLRPVHKIHEVIRNGPKLYRYRLLYKGILHHMGLRRKVIRPSQHSSLLAAAWLHKTLLTQLFLWEMYQIKNSSLVSDASARMQPCRNREMSW